MNYLSKFHSFVLLFLLLSTAAFSQFPAITPVRGMYVNKFNHILGNAAAEDSLLNYAGSKRITYLTLYDLHRGIIGNSAKEQQLSNFIVKAKLSGTITNIGAALESHALAGRIQHGPTEPIVCLPNVFSILTGMVDSTLFDDAASLFCFNQLHVGKFDWINIEYEYWLVNDTERDSAFAIYINTLKAVRKIAQKSIPAIKIEAYLGWPNANEVGEIDPLLDRVLLHAYRTSPNSTYAYNRTRLSYFAADNKLTHFLPIFSAEPEFMQQWVNEHTLHDAESIFREDWKNEQAAWKQHLQLDGYQWFTYSDMPKSAAQENMATTSIATSGTTTKLQEENIDILVFPNPADTELIVPYNENTFSENSMVHIYTINGQLIEQKQAIKEPLRIATDTYACGSYILTISDTKANVRRAKFNVIH